MNKVTCENRRPAVLHLRIAYLCKSTGHVPTETCPVLSLQDFEQDSEAVCLCPYTIPCASMASATLAKPAILAPAT